MKKLYVLVATAVAGLALAGVAQAGCMATVGLGFDAEGRACRREAVGGHDPRASARPDADA